MIWSFSSSKGFKRCQRQWFFKNYVANHRAKHGSLARKAYVLSKLGSVWAWRGKLVDTVITKHVVPAALRKRQIELPAIISIARDLYDRQLAFARSSSCWQPGLAVSRIGDDFAALTDIEYKGEVDEASLSRAWSDIETSLTNLLNSDAILPRLYAAEYMVAQRALQYTHTGLPSGPVKVKSFPDLIVFFADAAPLIVDWKVHTFGSVDYRLQLATYALTLTRCDPHRDFPEGLSAWTPSDIDLSEAQLLRNQVHPYRLDETDLAETEAHIDESAAQMHLAIDGKAKEELTPQMFPTTGHPQTCQSCAFRSLCWEEEQQ